MKELRGFIVTRKKWFKFVLFVFCFTIGFLVYDRIKLSFSNPWNITGPLTLKEYNPANNIIRFLFLILLPSVALFFTKFTKLSEPVKAINNIKMNKFLLIMLLCLVLIIGFLSVSRFWGQFFALDIFHDGESIGTAEEYLNGKAPYKDMIFIHGPFQDPLRSVLAFKLFGKSIGAVKTLDGILTGIALILLMLFLYILYRKNALYTLSSILAFFILTLTQPFWISFFIYHKDILLCIFLISAFGIYNAVEKQHSFINHLLFFSATFVATLGFAYSIDRGFFLSAATINIWLIYFLFFRSKSYKIVFSILGGYLMGIIALGFAIRWAYVDFFKFVFIIIPQYYDLSMGYVFHFEYKSYLTPVILIAAGIFWLLNRFFKSPTFRSFFYAYFMEILLCMLAVFYFKNALGRGDAHTVFRNILPLFLLWLYIVVKHYIHPVVLKIKKSVHVVSILTILVGIFFLFTQADALRGIDFKDIFRLPLAIKDEEFMKIERCAKTISFLRDNMEANDEIFVMTSEAIWYYFLDKKCPTRFPIVWFATPYFYQEEIVKDLKEKNVKFIIHSAYRRATNFDDISSEIRFPIIMDYIEKNYEFYISPGPTRIWIKK